MYLDDLTSEGKGSGELIKILLSVALLVPSIGGNESCFLIFLFHLDFIQMNKFRFSNTNILVPKSTESSRQGPKIITDG